jgi:hypothetical protein
MLYLQDVDGERIACCDLALNDKPAVSVLTAEPGAYDCAATSNSSTSNSSTSNSTSIGTRNSSSAAAMSVMSLLAALLAAMMMLM